MNEFIKMSKYAGMREDLIQAGGGNSSYKITADKMMIKASGYQLADMTPDEGYAIVNPKIIRDAFLNIASIDDLTDEQSNQILKEAFIEGKRPSIETFLHSISGRYTLHTHPIVVNAMTCRKGGMKKLSELFPEALIVPYEKPGVKLAKAYFKAYKAKSEDTNKVFDVVFLQNHGLLISAETADEVIQKTEEVVRQLELFLGCNFSDYHMETILWKYFEDKIVWCVTDKNVLDIYAKHGLWSYQFSPDCIVFLGKSVLKLENGDLSIQIAKYREKNGEPVILAYDGKLFIIASSVKKALEIQSVLSFSAQVMDINCDYACNLLSDEQQDELLNWDAEKYRQNIK